MQSLCIPVLAATLLAFSSPMVAATAAPAISAARLAPLNPEAPGPVAAMPAASATLVAQAGNTGGISQAPTPNRPPNPSTASDTPLLVILGTALLVVVFVSLRRRPER
ncbi:MAG: hypothetical protein LW854_09330 [Rubrivivax sp.]|jgi:LPXTG-motif cell wall-anchored protein|nr:hypothetical protein [Rubrivivax sp.]